MLRLPLPPHCAAASGCLLTASGRATDGAECFCNVQGHLACIRRGGGLARDCGACEEADYGVGRRNVKFDAAVAAT